MKVCVTAGTKRKKIFKKPTAADIARRYIEVQQLRARLSIAQAVGSRA